MLADLEKIEVAAPAFGTGLESLAGDLLAHVENEEQYEFPLILSGRSPQKQKAIGGLLRVADRTALTHPHPTAAGSTAGQYALGPFASLLDHARDALRAVTD